MKKIVCQFNLFDLHQQIMLADENDLRIVAISTLSKLGEDIAMMCNKYDCHKVQLYGSASFAKQIKFTIMEVGMNQYDMHDISVEVN